MNANDNAVHETVKEEAERGILEFEMFLARVDSAVLVAA